MSSLRFCALTAVGPLLSMKGQKALGFHQNILIFGWTIPLNHTRSSYHIILKSYSLASVAMQMKRLIMLPQQHLIFHFNILLVFLSSIICTFSIILVIFPSVWFRFLHITKREDINTTTLNVQVSKMTQMHHAWLTSLAVDLFHLPPGSCESSSPSCTVWRAASLCLTCFLALLTWTSVKKLTLTSLFCQITQAKWSTQMYKDHAL